jgi:hypothetical protein
LDYKTIIVSKDVVMADSIACQLMGYKPLMEFEDIKMDSERGLGDAKAHLRYEQPTIPPSKGWELGASRSTGQGLLGMGHRAHTDVSWLGDFL